MIPINIFVVSMIIYGAVFAFFISWIVFIIREEREFRMQWKAILPARWIAEDWQKEYSKITELVGKDKERLFELRKIFKGE